ncbi:MAG: response regulator [Planctomycetes bacterium]|nr:response regulator [Planctomycetota bacterium]MCB9913134.1 response regulator [Planctomycetota bacterium]HPF14447.1 HD domain-containing phosphohydrolase [Planctomycetota bacterium]HRV80815.1 HD domain-containing phosphohydrolase [Planctomycetota bacterium]
MSERMQWEQEQPRVLLVDDELGTIEMIGAMLDAQGFDVTLCCDVGEATRLISDESFAAVVSDVVFDGNDRGGEVLAASRSLSPDTVRILMTGYPVIEGAVSAIKHGAIDYLQKPVDPLILAATIRRALHERRVHPEQLVFQDLVNILSDMVAQTIERVDPYTAGHGERTRTYCRQIAQRFGLDVRTIERLELAAIAHDYGKIYLDDLNFLTKKGPLTAAEYKAVQRHPALGAQKLGTHPHLKDACQYVAEHHERWDGTGYPLRLKGKDISEAGRILCVVEVFDSISTRRSYKNPWDLDKCIDFFESQSGRAFEPEVLDIFLGLLHEYGHEWLAAPARDLAKAQARREESTLLR